MSNPVKKRSRLRRWIVGAIAMLVVLAALVSVVFYALARSASSRWEQLAAEVRASGEPLTYEEIIASPPRFQELSLR